MGRVAVKIGAALYICWGLLHFPAAFGVYKLAQTSAGTVNQGRLLQTAFYLAAFAAAAIAFAITLNWRNNRLGFWACCGLFSHRAWAHGVDTHIDDDTRYRRSEDLRLTTGSIFCAAWPQAVMS
jgi:hypothetical protein